MFRKIGVTIGGLAAMLVLGAANPAASLENGDRVTIVVPYSPGGGFDTQARLIAPHLESKLREAGYSGVNVVVNNVRGGGGAIGTSQVYGDKPDGTTLLLLDPESSLWQQTLSDTVFDLNDFTYLAQISSDPFTFSVRSDLDVQDFAGLVERSHTTPILVATSGHGSIDQILPLIVQKILGENGTEFSQQFLSFSGTSDKIASMRRGESEMTVASTTAIQGFVGEGVVRIILTFDEKGAEGMQAKALLKLPEDSYAKLAAGSSQRRVFVAPPGMDEATRDKFRSALDAVLTDPAVVAEAEKAHQLIDYMPGAEVETAIHQEIELAKQYGDYVAKNVEE